MLNEQVVWTAAHFVTAVPTEHDTNKDCPPSSPFVPLDSLIQKLHKDFHIQEIRVKWDSSICSWAGRIVIVDQSGEQDEATVVNLRTHHNNRLEVAFVTWRNPTLFATSEDVDKLLPSNQSQWKGYLNERRGRARDV